MNRNENSIKAVRILEPDDLAALSVRHRGERNQRPAPRGLVITVRICICCGEPMVERGNALSRNPKVCASCSSLADGMEAENETKMSHEILP
jgi:formylmethanofuran dehydrogenase subunit E